MHGLQPGVELQDLKQGGGRGGKRRKEQGRREGKGKKEDYIPMDK
jgi:hypothetical protein